MCFQEELFLPLKHCIGLKQNELLLPKKLEYTYKEIRFASIKQNVTYRVRFVPSRRNADTTGRCLPCFLTMLYVPPFDVGHASFYRHMVSGIKKEWHEQINSVPLMHRSPRVSLTIEYAN